MLLLPGFLSYFLLTFWLAWWIGLPARRIVLLASALVLGGLAGSGLCVLSESPSDLQELTRSQLPWVGAVGTHLIAGLLQVVGPWRVRSLGRSAQPGQRRVSFPTDEGLALALDTLEDQHRIKYVPGDPVDAERPWAYEAWAEAVEDRMQFTSYRIVPLSARLRLRRDAGTGMNRIEPRDISKAVIVVPGRIGAGAPVAIAVSDDRFCREVMRSLATG